MILCVGCPFQQRANLAKSSRETRSVKEVADPETSTPNGCTCNSLCGATIEDGFTKDWCTVEGKDFVTLTRHKNSFEKLKNCNFNHNQILYYINFWFDKGSQDP